MSKEFVLSLRSWRVSFLLFLFCVAILYIVAAMKIIGLIDGRTSNITKDGLLHIAQSAETTANVHSVTSLHAVSSISRDDCHSIVNDDNIGFRNRGMLSYPDQIRHPHPSYLFSYGGSGNTFTRLLMESVTNIWTGSTVGDPILKAEGFKGEDTVCRWLPSRSRDNGFPVDY